MSDRCFVDSNVFVYLFGDEIDKKRQAGDLLITARKAESFVISTQVIGEFVNV